MSIGKDKQNIEKTSPFSIGNINSYKENKKIETKEARFSPANSKYIMLVQDKSIKK